MGTPLSLRRTIRLLFLFGALSALFYMLPFPLSLPADSSSQIRVLENDSRAPSTRPARDRDDSASPPHAESEASTPSPISQAPPLATLNLRPDGLVVVNPDGPHPIYELMARAEREWKEKLDRQSRTLEQAAMEYKRWYRRAPPKGFDLWYVWSYD